MEPLIRLVEAEVTQPPHTLLDVVGGPASTKSEYVVTISGVEKWYGPTHVLKGIDLTVHRGECVCIIGPSGSGKSTLLRCIACLDPIDHGSVAVGGHEMGYTLHGDRRVRASPRALARQRQDVGMVFQRFNLFPHMTALENVVSGLIRVRHDQRASAESVGRSLLDRVGLIEKVTAYPAQLSGGQQQRVAICRAVAMRPAVLLLDEPTSALDPEMIGEVLAVIEELVVEGMTMVLVTHEMKFGSRAARRVAMMYDGSIIDVGPPQKVFNDPDDPRTKQFLSRVL